MNEKRPSSDPSAFGIGRIFEATRDGIILVDGEGRIALWNPAARAMFGYEEREAVGMNVARLVPPEHLSKHHAGMKRFQRTGHGAIIDSGKPVEVPALRKDGTRFWIDLSLSPLHHEGRPYALGIVRDVTERVELRERRETDKRQLQDAYDSLEAFASVVSHDLKEPVRAVGAYLDELQADPDAPDRADLLQRAATAHKNMQRLLEGLLEWSRAAKTPLEPEVLLIHEVLGDPGCAAQWENLLRERGARLEVSRDIPPVLATEALLCRVFGNLITNAIRHNAGPQPLIRIRQGDSAYGLVEVLVEDNGPGFPPHVVEHQERPTTLKGGFGLTITRHAVERLRGDVALGNKPEGGALVRLRLPVAPSLPHARTSLEQRVRELV